MSKKDYNTIEVNFSAYNKFKTECEKLIAKENHLSTADKKILLEEAKKYGYEEIIAENGNKWR